MPQISITVNGRAYSVSCEEGDEEHLMALGRYFDKRVRELSQSIGQVGETRLFLIAGLTAADDLSEALAKIEDLEAEVEAIKEGRPTVSERVERTESMAAEMLEVAARRLEDIAGRLEAS
jgi:cell division protein ZapA